jgi:glycosyltransferase involved in cell wall biosynthesis
VKILIVTQYFWPEYFQINDFTEELVNRGNEVSVLTGLPNYPHGKFFQGYSFLSKRKEYYKGITIYRSPLISRGSDSKIKLLLNYISFAFLASIRLMFIEKKFDKIIVYAPSPITVGIPGIIAKYKFKAPVYLWVQDLWPESISSAGGISNSHIIKIINKLTVLIYKYSNKILVQSKGFIPYIVKQGVDENKIIYLPNSTESFHRKVSTDNEFKKLIPKHGTTLMFAGNIGESQGFETIVKSALYLNDLDFKLNWVILGDGRRKESIMKKIRKLGIDKSFFFLGSFPAENMPYFFTHTDALLVTLKKSDNFSLTIPSKIQTYMANSKPIIASLDGEGARVILESKCGYVSPAEDYVAFSKSIINFLKLNDKEKESLGSNARKYFDDEFERSKQIDLITDILNDKIDYK